MNAKNLNFLGITLDHFLEMQFTKGWMVLRTQPDEYPQIIKEPLSS